jgi:tRNA threonylcarbamoyladenosine biosynthesis protein TsaB
MSSLRQILAAHAPLLVIDAASTVTQVGWLTSDSSVAWQTSTDEAGVAIFQCIEKLTAEAGADVNAAGAFVFSDGPGSVLGIRTVAMALRTWNVLKPRPVFAYCSLALVAHALGREEVTVIADARREAWHAYQIGRGLRRVPASELHGELIMPENFRNWSALPPSVGRVPYSVAELLPRAGDIDLFQPTDAPDAFLHEEPSYVRWTPQIHRAPGEK